MKTLELTITFFGIQILTLLSDWDPVTTFIGKVIAGILGLILILVNTLKVIDWFRERKDRIQNAKKWKRYT